MRGQLPCLQTVKLHLEDIKQIFDLRLGMLGSKGYSGVLCAILRFLWWRIGHKRCFEILSADPPKLTEGQCFVLPEALNP